RVEDGLGIVDVAEALAMQRLKCRAHLVGGAELDGDGRVAAGRAQPGAAFEADLVRCETLPGQVVASRFLKRKEALGKVLAERLQDSAFPWAGRWPKGKSGLAGG